MLRVAIASNCLAVMPCHQVDKNNLSWQAWTNQNWNVVQLWHTWKESKKFSSNGQTFLNDSPVLHLPHPSVPLSEMAILLICSSWMNQPCCLTILIDVLLAVTRLGLRFHWDQRSYRDDCGSRRMTLCIGNSVAKVILFDSRKGGIFFGNNQATRKQSIVGFSCSVISTTTS